MPLNFTVDANTYLSTPNIPVSVQPLTLSCWFRYTGAPAAASLLCLYDTVNGDQIRLRYNGSNGLIAEVINFGVSTATTGIVSTSANAWHHGALTFASGTSNLKVYEDGAVGTSATPPTVTAADGFFVGANDTTDNPFDGLLSHVAAWDVALTAAEILALARGISPIRIRPQNLQAFWPMRSTTTVNGWGVPNHFRNSSGDVTNRRNLNSIETPPTVDNSTFPPVAEFGWPQDVISVEYQGLIPNADVTDGGWTDQGGGPDLFDAIDEAPPADDANYIKSPDVAGGSSITKIALSDPTTQPTEPFYVSYRYGRIGDSGASLTVRLLQGTTTIAEWIHPHVAGVDNTTASQELTALQFAAITDFSDLYLEFESGSSTTYSELTYRGASVNNSNLSTYTFSSLDFGTPSDDRYVCVGSMSNVAWPSEMTIGGVVAQQVSGVSGALFLGMHIAHVPEGATGNIVITLASAATACAIVWWTVRMGHIGFNSTGGDTTAGINPVLTATSMHIPENGFALGVTAVAGDTTATVSLNESYIEAAAEQATESWMFCPIQREVVSETTHTLTATWTANTATEGLVVLFSFSGDGG